MIFLLFKARNKVVSFFLKIKFLKPQVTPYVVMTCSLGTTVLCLCYKPIKVILIHSPFDLNNRISSTYGRAVMVETVEALLAVITVSHALDQDYSTGGPRSESGPFEC